MCSALARALAQPFKQTRQPCSNDLPTQLFRGKFASFGSDAAVQRLIVEESEYLGSELFRLVSYQDFLVTHRRQRFDRFRGGHHRNANR